MGLSSQRQEILFRVPRKRRHFIVCPVAGWRETIAQSYEALINMERLGSFARHLIEKQHLAAQGQQ
jgi:hypothetical protein